ncbi:putative peptidoglycan lipid II flippase [Desulfocicer vacuolatum DSM 3385]|uniref:Probable lipid II flippase MurJ n=1 Tax=Desulfocicer vacuolatum DSM 3385 TaxID=1121400 RepID=A0A1W2B894_9BACT|nr:murein biosynthesis integral membrane protein MurJ [Desulfocicer vacuolatum]SMC69243.1 putative peptidoglycan lipid II flippase [Desulfocicer vacuolatum DSM 3385]
MTSSKNTLKKIGVASFIMMASVFASRIIGLFREMTIAYAGGAGGGVDAYQVAFIIPEILNHVVASGFLSVTFIPIFSGYLAQKDEKGGWEILSIILNTFGALLLLFLIMAFCFAPQLVSLLAPGLTDPVLFAKAVRMTRIIMPAQLCFFSGGLFMAVQFTREQFMIPALAPLIYNLGIILGGLLLGPTLGMEGFAWGVLLGAFAGNFLLQYIGAKKCGMKLSAFISLTHPDFIKYLLLTLPLMVGLTMTFSTEILLKYFGSFLEEGSIAALNYALRVMFILVGLFGQAVGVASYPFMAKLAAQGNMDELNQLLNTTLKFLILVIPVSVLVMVLRQEIVFLLFQRGQFDATATELTSRVLPFLMAGTVAFAAQTVVVRGYYAMQNTWFPAIVGSAAVVISLPIFYGLMHVMGARGIALALTLGAIFQTGLLFALWNRKSNNREGGSVYLFFIKIGLISMAIGWLLLNLSRPLTHIFNVATVPGALAMCMATTAVFTGLFVGSGVLLKIEEIQLFTKKIMARVK